MYISWPVRCTTCLPLPRAGVGHQRQPRRGGRLRASARDRRPLSRSRNGREPEAAFAPRLARDRSRRRALFETDVAFQRAKEIGWLAGADNDGRADITPPAVRHRRACAVVSHAEPATARRWRRRELSRPPRTSPAADKGWSAPSHETAGRRGVPLRFREPLLAGLSQTASTPIPPRGDLPRERFFLGGYDESTRQAPRVSTSFNPRRRAVAARSRTARRDASNTARPPSGHGASRLHGIRRRFRLQDAPDHGPRQDARGARPREARRARLGPKTVGGENAG